MTKVYVVRNRERLLGVWRDKLEAEEIVKRIGAAWEVEEVPMMESAPSFLVNHNLYSLPPSPAFSVPSNFTVMPGD